MMSVGKRWQVALEYSRRKKVGRAYDAEAEYREIMNCLRFSADAAIMVEADHMLVREIREHDFFTTESEISKAAAVKGFLPDPACKEHVARFAERCRRGDLEPYIDIVRKGRDGIAYGIFVRPKKDD